ncbi:p21-activated protein kinase-interacting protein 1-like [Lycorma delicatula]|uniref:p21-activated protein kinase-interacting protein 1-like n=1 Tax=Lycorma delicatula TaxID=130591 RepID=UPI003F5160C0
MAEKCVFEVIVGTYEQFILGYKFIKPVEGGKPKFVHSFANHSHQGSVKCVSTSGKWVASSSTDETIHLYDMIARKESGLLMEQNGTISSISFTPDTSYLISASEDGSIALFKTGSWRMENLWKMAHKGSAVTCVAIHPSGKMVLSLGKNRTLRTWNLIKGRAAYTTNLARCKAELELVVWSKSGDHYAVPVGNTLELFSVETGGVSQVFKFKTKVTSTLFLSDKVIGVGEDSGELSGQCVETGLELWKLTGGEKRIRGIAVYKNYLITGCSNGTISAYKLSTPAEEPNLITTISAGCRITCLCIYINEIKLKKQDNEENDNKEMKQNGHTENSVKTATINENRSKHNASVKCIPREQNWEVRNIKKIKR